MSLKRQIAVTFITLFLLSAVLMIVMTNTLFPGYYKQGKIDALHQAVERMNSMEDNLSDPPKEFDEFCLTNNLEVTAADEMLHMIYTNRDMEKGENMVGRLFVYLVFNGDKRADILESNSEYILQQSKDPTTQIEFLEMWGRLDNGNYYIVRTPIPGIEATVSIVGKFYLSISLIVSVLGTILIFFITKRITKPIMELTDLSEKMAGLDFDVHYTGGSNQELDCLGYNFNKMSDTLEHTISELKTANNELMKDIEKKNQLDEMRKEFLSNVTHELKTPIALIQGYAEGLRDNINEDQESRDFYCDVIVDEAGKMNNMVKKLLNLNQLEFGNEQVTMERFDLVAVIRGIIQSSRILIEQNNAKVIFREEEPISVWGDEFKVEEVITNYLTNALNHLNEEKTIEIFCRQEGKRVRTTVFNTGEPIPQDELDKIWIKFYKVDKARTREYGGNGIGLSIVKAIMDSMHQECGVENYKNGVAFWFTLERK